MKKMIRVLNGQTVSQPPFWLMRQAGRYLPEYKETRKQAGSFLDLCYNPELATEVTMQPLRRFGMDAAILFSDILVIPDALGQDVCFVEGEGPKLDPIRNKDQLAALSLRNFHDHLGPVYETVSSIKSQLQTENFHETALIGFAGAPWTVACYMVEGGGSKEFMNIKRWAYFDPDGFQILIDLLIDATTQYLLKQIEAGAEIIQLFDSWASVLSETEFMRWVIEPTKQIVEKIKQACPDIPIIGFPRGAGILYKDYADQTGVNSVSLDYQLPLDFAATELQSKIPVQGNLDPMCLLAGGDRLERETERILTAFSKRPFIFNLGHGIHKDTPPSHVEKMVKILKD